MSALKFELVGYNNTMVTHFKECPSLIKKSISLIKKAVFFQKKTVSLKEKLVPIVIKNPKPFNKTLFMFLFKAVLSN